MMDEYGQQLMDQLTASRERAVLSQLGLNVRATVRVTVRKPRWMPERTYRWLLRTIVVEQGPIVIGETSKPLSVPKIP